MTAIFRFGQIICTASVNADIERKPGYGAEVENCLLRHLSGDWGDLCKDDAEMNNEAIKAEQEGKPTDSLYSSYKLNDGTDLWIITECDRSVTTILYPEEY